jgi:diaminohydroxyphosphoribosylaminopyrimidine deaminase/5-amino-6-(5-phosphoribosylamino)uracil reductase
MICSHLIQINLLRPFSLGELMMSETDEQYMLAALKLARKGYGRTSPNPMVGAVLVKGRAVIGKGWHRRAGGAHAEVAAIEEARRNDYNLKGSTLYVNLEPCCTTGRTPPCTQAIIDAGIRRVVVGAVDPNPGHSGRGLRILKRSGIEVTKGVFSEESSSINAAFNHWIASGLPYVTLKSAMTLDGKIATATGESKWITQTPSRREGMRLRKGSDVILVGVNTVLADNPSLLAHGKRGGLPLRRIILDSRCRTPLSAKVVSDECSTQTTVVTLRNAPPRKILALRKKVRVIKAPERKGRVDLKWLMKRLGGEQVVNLLVEGGGEVGGAFLDNSLVNRVAFFYAPIIMGGKESRVAAAGFGVRSLDGVKMLCDVQWRRLGSDLLLTAGFAGD